jgi:hypothetical protein
MVWHVIKVLQVRCLCFLKQMCFGSMVYAVLCVQLLLKFSRCSTGNPTSKCPAVVVLAWNPVPCCCVPEFRRSRVRICQSGTFWDTSNS